MSKLCKFATMSGLVVFGLLSAPVWAQVQATQPQGDPTQPAPPQTGPGADAPPPDGNDPPPPPRFDPRRRMMGEVQHRLGMTADDFKAIEPQIQKLLDLQRDTHPRPMGPPGGPPPGGGFGGPPGPPPGEGGPDNAGPGGPSPDNAGPPPAPPGADNAGPPPGAPPGPDGGGPPEGGQRRPPRPQSDVQKKLMDLRRTLDKSDSSAEEIKAKLDAYEDSLAKAKEELAKAQEDLKGKVTARQEAVLISMGLLD